MSVDGALLMVILETDLKRNCSSLEKLGCENPLTMVPICTVTGCYLLFKIFGPGTFQNSKGSGF